METFIRNFLDVVGHPGVNVLVTIILIIVYCKQTKILRSQEEIQALSINLNAADKLQTLYDSYFNLNRFLFYSRNEMFTPAIVAHWKTEERIKEFGEFRSKFIQEVQKVDFFVSKDTLQELREYCEASLTYWNELCSLHIIILPSYNELADRYDDVYREFQDSDYEMSVSDFMMDIAKVDEEYKYFYHKFATANRDFELKSNTLLKKFKAKEGIGSII